MDLVAAINDERTGLFTLGCVSGEVADSQGFRYTDTAPAMLPVEVARPHRDHST